MENNPQPHYKFLSFLAIFLVLAGAVASTWKRYPSPEKPKPDWAVVHKIDTLHSKIK